MADNYLQFSEVVARLKKKEEAWLKKQLQPIRVFAQQGVSRRRRARRTGRHRMRIGPAFGSCATRRTTIPIGMCWVLSTASMTTTIREVGAATCGSTRKNLGARTTLLGWCRSFSKSSGPTSAGRSPTPPHAQSPVRASLAAGRCLSRPTDQVAKRLRFHRGPDGQPSRTERGGLRLCMGRSQSRAVPRASSIRRHCTSPTSEPAANQEDAESVLERNLTRRSTVEVDGKQLRESDGIVFEYKGDEA